VSRLLPGPACGPWPESKTGDNYVHLDPLLEQLAELDAADPRRSAIRDKLVAGYLPIVRHIAYRNTGRGEPKDDLVQVGTVGLIGAIDRFKPAYGGNFLSFAVPTITGEIRGYFPDRAWAMRVPRRMSTLIHAKVGRRSGARRRSPGRWGRRNPGAHGGALLPGRRRCWRRDSRVRMWAAQRARFFVSADASRRLRRRSPR
jgi:hypothetical protein